MAPSAKKRQPWHFTVLSKAQDIQGVVDCLLKKIDRLRLEDSKISGGLDYAATTASIMRNASAIVFIQYSKILRGEAAKTWEEAKRLFDFTDIQSIGAAIQNILLQAADMGIASLWVCDILLAHDEICDLLDMKYPFVATVLLGYEAPRRTARIDAEEKTVWLN